MKKVMAPTIVAALVLLATSGAAVPAQTSKPIACVIDIQFDCVQMCSDENEPNCWDCAWRGPITGCSLTGGTIEFREQPQNRWPGKTEHFFEKFIIYAPGGGTISGDNAGVWNFATFKFRANGRVTEASPEWAHLAGAKFHEMGTTSDPATTWPITGFGTEMTLH